MTVTTAPSRLSSTKVGPGDTLAAISGRPSGPNTGVENRCVLLQGFARGGAVSHAVSHLVGAEVPDVDMLGSTEGGATTVDAQ
jgi:hypothetical protein